MENVIPDDRDHVFHQYTVLCDGRDAVREALLSQEIACAIYYPVPLHRQVAFADTDQPELPVTETTSERCLSLPVFPEMTQDELESVVQQVRSFFHKPAVATLSPNLQPSTASVQR